MTKSSIPFDPALVPARATGIVQVDLTQIRANWSALAKLVAPAECAAVVKADAYGLGAGQIVPALAAEGCKTFFVATADEAEEARNLAPSATVYVLDGDLDSSFMAAIGAQPVLNDLAEVRAWSEHCKRTGNRLPAALQVDTGLNRRGIAGADVSRLSAELMASFEPTLVMSHLACGDDPGHAMNEAQLSNFLTARQALPKMRASLAASDGLMLGRAYHFDLVRPGYAVYGGQAFRGGKAPVKPAASAYAKVLQVRDVPVGQRVGYSATWSIRSPSRIATIAAGYADGVFRHASATDELTGGIVAINGVLCPIVGRVSMDLVTVDVTATGDAGLQLAGGWAELLGPSVSYEEAGGRAGTIGYEALTRIGRRFHRIYAGGKE